MKDMFICEADMDYATMLCYVWWAVMYGIYCEISNISRTKSQYLNDSRLVLQLSLPNPLKPGVKSWMKM